MPTVRPGVIGSIRDHPGPSGSVREQNKSSRHTPASPVTPITSSAHTCSLHSALRTPHSALEGSNRIKVVQTNSSQFKPQTNQTSFNPGGHAQFFAVLRSLG